MAEESADGKKVTLQAVNNLKTPNFDITVTLKNTHSRFLIDMLKEAAKIEPGFDKFVVRYHADLDGYFVLAINGAYANYEEDQTYWSILSGDEPIEFGVSVYEPRDGETVTFKLVTPVTAPDGDPCK